MGDIAAAEDRHAAEGSWTRAGWGFPPDGNEMRAPGRPNSPPTAQRAVCVPGPASTRASAFATNAREPVQAFEDEGEDHGNERHDRGVAQRDRVAVGVGVGERIGIPVAERAVHKRVDDPGPQCSTSITTHEPI